MAKQWAKSIRKTGQLSYFLDPSVKGHWRSAIVDAIKEFNVLEKRHKFGIKFVAGNDAPDSRRGSDLGIIIGNGEVEFSYGGDHSTVLEGDALMGRMQLLRVGDNIEKAFMLLPATPKVNTPSGKRITGEGVMKAIALHELIHACGLENSDHTVEDVFNGTPNINSGSTPAKDRLMVPVNGKMKPMPPIIFSTKTAAKISRLWT